MFPTVHPPSRDNSLVWPHFLLTGVTTCTFVAALSALHDFAAHSRWRSHHTAHSTFHVESQCLGLRNPRTKPSKLTPRRKSPTETVPLIHADNLSDREPDTPPQEPRHRTASPVGHSPTISTPDENLQARLGRLEKVFDEVSELKKHILEFTAVIPQAAGTCEHSSRQHGHDNAHEHDRDLQALSLRSPAIYYTMNNLESTVTDRRVPAATPPHITLAGMSGAERRTECMDYIDPAARAYISHHADDALPKFTATMGQGQRRSQVSLVGGGG